MLKKMMAINNLNGTIPEIYIYFWVVTVLKYRMQNDLIFQ